ncbi:MAG: hypothetical protein HOG15_03295, partial [Anaerolineae bacterium]|nr:hypothetical protein [Anaerolineae bacterium]
MKKVSYVLFALLVVGALVLAACTPAATPEPAPEPEAPPPTEEPPPPEPTEAPPAIGSEEHPIQVLFVPSVDVDFMIAGGDLIETALNEATGLYFE